MAYMNQERKAALTPAIKAVCKKYNVKATLSVYHHSTLCLNVKSSPIDFIGNFNKDVDDDNRRAKEHINVNPYWFRDHFDGIALDFISEVHAAMMTGNHDRSDLMTDYFDVGWYVDINIGQWNKPYVLTH